MTYIITLDTRGITGSFFSDDKEIAFRQFKEWLHTLSSGEKISFYQTDVVPSGVREIVPF